MLDTYTIRTHDMPEEMRILLDRYPRESWADHPGFAEKTRHWLGAHRMFRRLAAGIRQDGESLLDGEMEAGAYADRLAYLGGHLIANLHGHHGWEDRSYFPELSAADPRFDAGLALLEQDHADLDAVLDTFDRRANRAIVLADLEPAQLRDAAGEVHATAETIEAFLERHLGDEEDLAVPIILHHRLRG
ncbi:hemerythrin domain-containing protein [Jannaschia seohaensis]|uniref:Hemerythrin HHE cation binding domain-containing protein n=1 Tax=Jannaschia seohaensis TaxID=475081 RepID=A0A2Y9AYJ6_9RHOB|nr:hemerythrin domain-containing protein [Jannaschia seohaensis]PWJ17536.1 hemerythrin HHE cation binding domain-containing protein [Jannaschia seohaensis]SSA47677.1 Hemerythrin HHE cation binding domain-containing protein [Jannaschia seohaensis]